MPTVKVPLGTPAYTNVDGVQLTDASYRIHNAFVDETEAIVKRPGYTSLFTSDNQSLNQSIRNMFWWSHIDKLVTVTGSNVYLTKKNGEIFDLTRLYDQTSLGTILNGNKRPSIATDGTYLYVAEGKTLAQTTTVSGQTYFIEADATITKPTTHVAYLDGYLLCNIADTTGFQFSDPVTHTPGSSWTADDYASAVGDPDVLNALYVYGRELLLFGPTSLEVWENDGTTPFSRLPTGYHTMGCIAPYSVAFSDSGVYWLNQNKRFVKYTGGAVEYASSDYDKEIQSYGNVSDCYSMRLDLAGRQLILFTFPVANKTLCYDIGSESWSEWGEWISAAGTYSALPISSTAYSPTWNLTLAGSTVDSTVYSISADNYSDNGTPIRMSQISGHINYGTLKRKRSQELRLIIKRGSNSSPASGGKLIVRFRDDGSSYWQNEIEVDLGQVGETEHVVKLYPRGIFKNRQYEIYSTDNIPVLYLEAEEDIDVMER